MDFDLPDFFDENEWDDPMQPHWGEFDWKKYLHESDGEIERFIQAYESVAASASRLDDAARLMGWDANDWSIDPADGSQECIPEAEQRRSPDFDPFTIHQHPVFIATRGLYLMARRGWETLLANGLGSPDPRVSWMMAKGFHEGEMSAVLATQAVEMGDVELAVCHFKQLLQSVNQSFVVLPDARTSRSKLVRHFDAAVRAHLFDLREIALRVISECRAESRRRPSDLE